jgi:O-antigen/teichoic acid export membrane protein
MSASYNLIARVLPGLTRDAAAGNHAGVNRLVLRLAIIGSGLAIAVGLASSAVGPRLVEVLYGTDFRPSSSLVGMAAAAVVFGIVGLGTTQVLVGRGHTDRLAAVWLLAVAVAAAVIVLVDADPTIRVVAAFLGGEAVAMIGLTVSALIPESRATTQTG